MGKRVSAARGRPGSGGTQILVAQVQHPASARLPYLGDWMLWICAGPVP